MNKPIVGHATLCPTYLQTRLKRRLDKGHGPCPTDITLTMSQ